MMGGGDLAKKLDELYGKILSDETIAEDKIGDETYYVFLEEREKALLLVYYRETKKWGLVPYKYYRLLDPLKGEC